MYPRLGGSVALPGALARSRGQRFVISEKRLLFAGANTSSGSSRWGPRKSDSVSARKASSSATSRGFSFGFVLSQETARSKWSGRRASPFLAWQIASMKRS